MRLNNSTIEKPNDLTIQQINSSTNKRLNNLTVYQQKTI